MKLKKILLAASTALFLGFTFNANAGYISDCQYSAIKLQDKAARLNYLAHQRRSVGDYHGYRRLKNTERIIHTHRHNLPCVGGRICLL